MRTTIYLSDGGTLKIADLDDGSALELRADLDHGESRFLALDMDGATVLVNRDHVVRVDLETGAGS